MIVVQRAYHLRGFCLIRLKKGAGRRFYRQTTYSITSESDVLRLIAAGNFFL
jgi:hypothetical protein